MLRKGNMFLSYQVCDTARTSKFIAEEAHLRPNATLPTLLLKAITRKVLAVGKPNNN